MDSITAPGGRKYKLTKTADNRITELRNQAGTLLATYSYHLAPDTNYLKRVTYGDGSWVEYSYDSATVPYKLKKVLASDNSEYFYKYDSNGRAIASFRSGGVDSIAITYLRRVGAGSNADSMIAIVRDALGNRVDSVISLSNALATDRLVVKGFLPGCSSCANEYTYDNHSNVLQKTSPLGVTEVMTYDTGDRLTKRTEASGTPFARAHTYRYANFNLVSRDSSGSAVNVSDSLIKRYFYDTNGNDTMAFESGLVSTGVRYFDTTRTVFNSFGQVAKLDGPRTDVADTSRFVFDSATSDLKEVREYAGSTALITQYTSYDAFGNPLTVIGPNSDTTTYQYDERQRVKKIKRTKGSSSDSTLYQYNAAGNITKIILPLGGADSIKYGYDLAGRLTSIVNGAGDSTLYTYDLMSNRKSERIRKGSKLFESSYFDYDALKRLVKACVGDSTDTSKYDCNQFGYDAVGNRTVQVSGKGDSTYFHYDALNRLDSIRQKHDGGFDTTVYTYDLQDNLTSVKDPSGNVTTYKYSDRGHLIQDSSAASGVTTYKYDQAGNLITKIPATGNADSSHFTYDALNRQTEVKLGAVSTYTFDYDAANNERKGRLWKETGPSVTRKFSYDYVGRVTAESLVFSGTPYPVLYSWDKNGNLSSMTYPSGRVVNYTYDSADRVFKATDTKGATTTTGLDSTFYLPFGPDTSMKLGNGIKVRKVFNRKYYADSIKNTTIGIFGRSYLYDHNGNITQLLDLVDSTKSYHSISYDGIDRLTQATGQFRTDTLFLSYKKNGNRSTKRKGGSATTTYNYTNNRLRNTTGTEVVNYGYNSNGSVIGDTASGSTKTYTYDKLNRMVKFTRGAAIDSFAYDAENKRVYKSDFDIIVNYAYDIFGNLIEEISEGNWQTDYIWANGEPRVRIDNAGAPETHYWYHTDHLGTPHVLTDNNKTVQWKISLNPFGETVSETISGTLDNLRFPGQYVDRSGGLNYNWFRYYQPKIGRYYRVDPKLKYDPMMEYSYVGNNPMNYVDPAGLIEGVHTDYNARTGEYYVHYFGKHGKYRYNQQGQLVTHYGKPIGKPVGEAKRALKWLRRVMPNFFKRDFGICKVSPKIPGLKGIKGGVPGVVSALSTGIDAYKAQKRSEETGIEVWKLMYYQTLGVDINSVEVLILEGVI